MSTLAEIALEEDLPGHSCTVCFEKFCASDVIHVPRILRCGHTFCTSKAVAELNFSSLEVVNITTLFSDIHLINLYDYD